MQALSTALASPIQLRVVFLHLYFPSGPCRKALTFSELHARASDSGLTNEQLDKAIDLGPEDGHDELVDLILGP